MDMLRSVKSAFAAALVMGLLGCGGGGGDSPAPTAPPPEFALTVEVAGTAATPDLAGKYTVRPGQSVVVKSNDAASWAGSDSGSGVTRTDVETGTSRWVSRFKNPSAVLSGAYKLTASASGGRTKTVDFLVQPRDSRSGDYTVFAANGSRQKLSIDYDEAAYTMTDAVGTTTSGTLTAPVAPARNWTVQSSRIVGTNTSSLRSVGDSIVGGFPFAVPFAAPATYAVYPFVATRAFVLTQGSLDGVYDRAYIQHLVGGGRQSAISQFAISGSGTVISFCTDATIYQVAHCPPANLLTFDVEADAQAGMWQMKDPVTGTSQGRFSVAEVDGEKIYLSAGTSPGDGSQVLTIGGPTVAGATTFTSTGWSTNGTLDVTNATSTEYKMSMTDAGLQLLDLTLGSWVPQRSIGIYSATQAPNTFFTMRSTRIELLIGARSSAQAGFLHVGIVD
jgi:hypothetical protein